MTVVGELLLDKIVIDEAVILFHVGLERLSAVVHPRAPGRIMGMETWLGTLPDL